MKNKKASVEIAERLNKTFSDTGKNSQKRVKILREIIKSNENIHFDLLRDFDKDKKYIIELLDLLDSLNIKIQFNAKSKI